LYYPPSHDLNLSIRSDTRPRPAQLILLIHSCYSFTLRAFRLCHRLAVRSILVRRMKLVLSLTAALSASTWVADARPPVPHSDADYATHIEPPEYPSQARLSRLQGSGMFALHIRADGSVESVEVIKTLGNTLLDQAAINAPRQWRFRPKSIKVARIPITFTIKARGGSSGIAPAVSARPLKAVLRMIDVHV